jgi:hypothetical protein
MLRPSVTLSHDRQTWLSRSSKTVTSPAGTGLADWTPYGNRESASPTRSAVDKSEWSASRFSLDSDRNPVTSNRVQELSEFRQVERSAERRAIRPVPAPSLWGGRGRRQRRERRGAMAIPTTAGSEVEVEAVRPAAQRPLGASSPERPASANRGPHRLDRPSVPPAGTQRKTERSAADRREAANGRRSR